MFPELRLPWELHRKNLLEVKIISSGCKWRMPSSLLSEDLSNFVTKNSIMQDGPCHPRMLKIGGVKDFLILYHLRHLRAKEKTHNVILAPF